MPGAGVRAVVFDLDDTLMVDGASIRAALTAVAGALPSLGGPGAAAEALTEAVLAEARRLWRAAPTYELCQGLGISSWEGLVSDFTGGHACVGPLRDWAGEYRSAAWRAALASLGCDDAAVAEAAAARFVTERRSRHVLFDDAVPALEALRAAGRATALVTNGPPDLQREKVAVSGLAALLDAVVVSGVVGVGKPDPAVLRVALDALGVAPAEAVMVGDNPRRDVAVGRAAGTRTVQVDRTGHDWGEAPAPDLHVADLVGFLDVVASL